MKNIFIIGAVLVLLVHFGILANPFKSQGEYVSGYDNEVVLYATSWCGYCKKTRELLAEKGIKYTEYDIEKSLKGKQDYDKLNGRGVPLMVINGNIVRGFNPNKIIQFVEEM